MFKNPVFITFWKILNVYKTQKCAAFQRIFFMIFILIFGLIEIFSSFLKRIYLFWPFTWILPYKWKQIVRYKQTWPVYRWLKIIWNTYSSNSIRQFTKISKQSSSFVFFAVCYEYCNVHKSMFMFFLQISNVHKHNVHYFLKYFNVHKNDVH